MLPSLVGVLSFIFCGFNGIFASVWVIAKLHGDWAYVVGQLALYMTYT